MHRFYDPNISPTTVTHTLSEDESKHACRVLRIKLGDRIFLLDGKGNLYDCTVINDHPKRCEISITDVHSEPNPDTSIHIAIAPTKNMDRMEWFVEKATEIGVTHITFLQTSNSERNQIKLDRLEKIAIAAMKQSKRLYLPELNEPVSFSEFITLHPGGLIAHCVAHDKNTLLDVFKPNNCPILIGPEGDFTATEIKNALENDYKPITLGVNRLRTETAGLYACILASQAI